MLIISQTQSIGSNIIMSGYEHFDHLIDTPLRGETKDFME